MRDCTAISKKNPLLHQFAASLNLNQRRRGFYYFLALLLFFSFTCYEEYNPKWIGGPRMKFFSSDFLTNEFRQTPDSERSMRRNLNTQPTLNDGVNSVWAQQMDFKHQIFFVNWSCVNSVWSHFGHRCNRRPQQQNNRLAVMKKVAGETLYLYNHMSWSLAIYFSVLVRALVVLCFTGFTEQG